MEKKINSKYVNIIAKSHSFVEVKTKNTKRLYKLQAGEKIANIVVDKKGEKISDEYNALVLYNDNVVEIISSDKRMAFGEQLEINKDINEINGMYFRLKGNLNNPKRILFSMPSLSVGHAEIKHFITTYSSLGEDFFKDNLVVALQDNYAEYGTYLLRDDNYESLIERIIGLIKKMLQRYSLGEDKAVFFGVSKGATSAIIYGSFFPQSTIISIAPQLDLSTGRFFTWNSANLFIDVFKDKGIKMIKFLQKIMSNQQKIYLYEGLLDVLSHDYAFTKDFYNNKNFHLLLGANDTHVSIVEQSETFNKLLIKKLFEVNNFNEPEISLDITCQEDDIRKMKFIVEDASNLDNRAYLYLNEQVSLVIGALPSKDGKTKEYIVYERANHPIGLYLPSLLVSDYQDIKLVFFNAKENIYVEKKIDINTSELKKNIVTNELKKKFIIKQSEIRDNYLLAHFELKNHEDIEQYKKLENPPKTYLLYKTSNQILKFPLFRVKDQVFVNTTHFIDLKKNMTFNDSIIILEIFPDESTYEQVFTYDEIKNGSNHFN